MNYENIVNDSNPPEENTGFCGRSKKACQYVSVIFARLFYFAHSLILIWRITVIFGNVYWYAALGYILFMIDLGIVLFKRKGREWNWFQPVVVIFLLIEIPCIWLLELDKVSETEVHYNKTAILEDFYQGKGQNILSKNTLSKETFTLVLEQSMLVVIIIARWLMPKGDLTRDQLSALLLVYLGTAADVVDFFSVLAEGKKLLLNRWFYMPILATWTWSMVQFIFVSTMVETNEEDEEEEEQEEDTVSPNEAKNDSTNNKTLAKKLKDANSCGKKIYVFLQSEAWGIIISVFMQDGPYVIVRMICLFYWKIRTYTNYFFTLKNALVLLLQLYRVQAVYEEHKRKKEADKTRKEKMMSMLAKQTQKPTNLQMERLSSSARMRKVQPEPITEKNEAWSSEQGKDFDPIW